MALTSLFLGRHTYLMLLHVSYETKTQNLGSMNVKSSFKDKGPFFLF